MSEQLVDVIHQQLDDAIPNNLYTGLAYGTPHPYCLPPTCFVPRMPDHPSRLPFRYVPRRVPHLNEDTSVRGRALHF